MSSVLLVLCSVISQCDLYYDIRYDGTIESKRYVRAELDGVLTEVPIINGFVPNIKIVKNFGRETRIFTYDCALVYNGKLIRYEEGSGCSPAPVTPSPPAIPPPVIRPRPLPELPLPEIKLVPPASLPTISVPKPLPKPLPIPPLPLPVNDELEKGFIDDYKDSENKVSPNY